MDIEYRKYIIRCWTWARETVINDLSDSDGKYDQELVVMLFNKVCQPYHYWQKEH